MRRASYAAAFGLAVFGLGTGGFMAFRRLEVETQAARAATVELAPAPEDTAPLPPFVPIAQNPREYAKYEAEDAQWRQLNARYYSLLELRVRGDGTRNPREMVEDKVYELKRRGQY